MSDHPTILQRLAVIDRRIDDARTQVAAGVGVDLSDLQGDVEAACEMIRARPPADDRDDIEQAVRKMLADLDALAEALNQQHRQLTGHSIDAGPVDTEGNA